MIKKIIKIVEAKIKSTILARIVLRRRMVRGKYTLVIKPPLLTIEPVADDSELANRDQGRRAT